MIIFLRHLYVLKIVDMGAWIVNSWGRSWTHWAAFSIPLTLGDSGSVSLESIHNTLLIRRRASYLTNCIHQESGLSSFHLAYRSDKGGQKWASAATDSMQ